MIAPVLMVSTFSITVQSLGEIEVRALAVGANIYCFCSSRLICLRMGDIV